LLDKAWAIIGSLTPAQLAIKVRYNPITNLSSKLILPSETTLLRKGLTFIPSNRSTPEDVEETIKQSFNKLTRSVRWLHIFQGSGYSKQSRLRRPSTLTPNRAPDHVEAYLSSCKDEILRNAHIPDRSMRFNYKRKELRSLYNIIQDKDIICLASDKNLGPVILDYSWKPREGYRQLEDTVTYEEEKGPAFKHYANNVLDHIEENKATFLNYLHERDYNGMVSKTKEAISEGRIPSFKLLPKLHKLKLFDLNFESTWTKLKGRPLISAHSCPTAYLSIWLSETLIPYVEDSRFVLKDTNELIATLDKYKNSTSLPKDFTFGTADVRSLYPNVPTDEGVRIVYDYLIKHGMVPELAELVRSSLLIVLKNNFFKFEDKFWIQLQGTAMGTHVGPAYANLFLCALEDKVAQLGILYFKRFVDDLFVIARNRAAASKFFNLYNELYPTIKLDVIVADTVDFMDITVSKTSANSVRYCLYSKPFNKFEYLPFTSAHPMHMKKAFIKGLILNLIRKSSDFELYFKDLKLAYDRLRSRGYPSSLLDPIFKDPALRYYNRDNIISPPIPLEEPASNGGLCFFNVPFNVSYLKLQASKVFHNRWPMLAGKAHYLARPPLTAWSRSKNIRDIINVANNLAHAA
jgi:hypothetical protein